jgi:transposase
VKREWKDDGWRIPEELWAKIAPLIPLPPETHPWGVHRPRVDNRAALDGIFFVLRTGCQWNALNATGICSSSSAHRRFQEWEAAGVFQEIWALGLETYDALVGIEWRWQAMDGAMHKAPLGGGKNRPQSDGPGQNGHKREYPGGRPRRPAGRGRGGRERQRLPVAGSHAGK